MLFARSIRENILLGLSNPKKVAGEDMPCGGPQMQDSELMDLAKKANAHDFISRMTQGYEEEVGERGVQLSGGRWQSLLKLSVKIMVFRMSFACLLLHVPAVHSLFSMWLELS